jgi:hypothetical protein
MGSWLKFYSGTGYTYHFSPSTLNYTAVGHNDTNTYIYNDTGDIYLAPSSSVVRLYNQFGNSSIVVYGSTGSGKTALVYSILSKIEDKTIYFVAHPKPKIIEQFGYVNLNSIEELEGLQNCVIFWDEPQLSLNVAEYKRDMALARVLSLARQRSILMIFATSDTRLLSPRVEAYIDYWCIKDCDYSMTKQRGRVRNIIQKNSLIMPEGFKLEQNSFLLDSRKLQLNGRYQFELIDNWCEELSKPYKLAENSQKTREKLAENSQKTRETQLNNSQKTREKLTENSENSQNSEKTHLNNSLKKLNGEVTLITQGLT